jgi:hypothetical protein
LDRRTPGMSQFSTLDRESFQKLLANAYAVQQSQMDSQSLSVIVELQRMITRGDLDVDEALHLLVNRAQNVANAAGVAIGLLRGDQLVYQAGSGSAAIYRGRSVTARLVVSTDSKTNREILRVENAETDTRIEAAICRQFGAKSLLILLIYHDQAVAGVLEVFFNEAHSFEDREVRTYRLMAGLAGEAVARETQPEQNTTATRETLTTSHSGGQIAALEEKFPNGDGSLPGPSNQGAVYEPREAARAVAGEPVITRPPETTTTVMRLAKRISWYNRRWNGPLGAVVTAFVLTCWIAYGRHQGASPMGSSTLQKSGASGQQAPLLPANAVPEKGATRLRAARVSGQETRITKSAVRRVRVNENEVDYIKEDVTVRYFTHKPAPHRVRDGKNEIAYIGDDVTVRYFMPKPAVASHASPIGTARPASGAWSTPANSAPSKVAK